MQGHSAQSQHKCAGDVWMACESWKALNRRTVTAAATSPLWLESGKLANTGRNFITFHVGTMGRNTSLPPKIPAYNWAVTGEIEGGVVGPFLVNRAGLALASEQGRSQHQAEGNGWKTYCSKFWGVSPSSSSLHGLEASQILQGPAERGQPFCVNWRTVLPLCWALPSSDLLKVQGAPL